MKRIILILFVFIPILAFSQNPKYTPLLAQDGVLFSLDGVLLQSPNTLLQRLELSLQATLISEDSLAYNSSGDLVLYANADTVVLDGSLDVVVGNSVRFGTPTSGTIHEILDTLGSSDTLILDQTFTGILTDEYYWGGVSLWYDNSGNGINATQTTAINQPKLLWAGTDSARVNFDGVNDYLNLSPTYTFTNNNSLYFRAEIVDDDFLGIVSNNTDFYNYLRFGGAVGTSLTSIVGETKTNGDNILFNPFTTTTMLENTPYNLVITEDASNNWNIYINSIHNGIYSTSDSDLLINKIGRSRVTDYLNGSIYNMSLYSKILSKEEINAIEE